MNSLWMLANAPAPDGRTPLIVVCCYLFLLLMLGLLSSRSFRGTSKDFFVASHSIGPFLLLMSVFGTTMTAFALVGSTGKSFERGIGVYGLMASASGLVHAAVFFVIGIKLWVFGKKYGYVTQIQFFRDRFESKGLGYVLFPILVGLVIPYLLIGIIGAGKTIQPISANAFPDLFPGGRWPGSIPPWLSGLVVCGVVLTYIFMGGSRGAAWANAFQTCVFMAMGLVAFWFISTGLGGLNNAGKVAMIIQEDGKIVQRYGYDQAKGGLYELEQPKVVGMVGHLENKQVEVDGKPVTRKEVVVDKEAAKALAGRQPHFTRTVIQTTYKAKTPKGDLVDREREFGVPPLMFLTYFFIPLSVGMFPHLFQHWLTAKSAKTFRLTVIAHPLFIMIVWVPCVLIGAWSSGLVPPGIPPAAVLGNVLDMLVHSPVLTGLLTAGVLAAIMSSLDSQFLCLGTMFTNDVVLHATGPDRFTDRQTLWISRGFIVVIVALTYGLSMVAPQNVFDLAVWCFSGFSSLFPLVLSALYWKRVTRAGAYACILATILVWGYFFNASGYGEEYTLWGGIMPVAVCTLSGAAALVIVSLLTKPPSRATIDKFFPPKKELLAAAENA